MTLWKLTKRVTTTLLIALMFIGVLLMIGNAMLEGEAYATFFGYKLSNNFINDDKSFIHVGDAIIIHDAQNYEYHHDTPIACFDDLDKRIYIYRIIHTEGEGYRVVDPHGTIMLIPTKNIIGKVIEC